MYEVYINMLRASRMKRVVLTCSRNILHHFGNILDWVESMCFTEAVLITVRWLIEHYAVYRVSYDNDNTF